MAERDFLHVSLPNIGAKDAANKGSSLCLHVPVELVS
jgi:hypothetical protein